mgnify:CR=1 FL=1
MPFLENGPFQVGLQTSKDQIDQALNLVKVTVKDFIDNGPTDSEYKHGWTGYSIPVFLQEIYLSLTFQSFPSIY